MADSAAYSGVEVRPEAVDVLLAAFDMFPSMGQKYLGRYGLVQRTTTAPMASRSYIPLAAWLGTFEAVLKDIGPNALYKIGVKIIGNPYLPVSLSGVEAGLRHIDVAFHMSHRIGGKPMFDPRTSTMLEGIGHYAVTRHGKEKKALVRCDTPYPCPLEQGIVSGVAMQIEPRAVVVHGDRGRCRATGSKYCDYLVTW